MPDFFELADAIDGLRAELKVAAEKGAEERMQFEIQPVEVTLQTVLTREGTGKVGWKILEFGGSIESATTQTLKVTLRPVWKMANGTIVRDFAIAGVQPEGKSGHVGPKSTNTPDMSDPI
jgi:hypothetical protein